MGSSMRAWTGSLLTIVGCVAWAWTLTILEPATQKAYAAEQAAVKAGTLALTPDVADMAQMVLIAKDVRWAALVLALGGLLVLLTARAMVVLGGVLWLAADIILDRFDVQGWTPLALSLVILSAVVTLAWFSYSKPHTPSRAAVLIYSGVAAALAPVLMFFVSPDVSPHRPADLLFVTSVVGVGLAMSAVAVALTAVPQPSPNLARRAMALAALVICPSIAAQLWIATHHVTQPNQVFLAWAATPLLLLGCILLVKGQPQGRQWLGFSGLAIAVGALSYVSLWIGILISYPLQLRIMPITGDRAFFDGYHVSVAGFGAGLLLGLIALATSRSALAAREAVL